MNSRLYVPLIWTLSLAVPLAVGVLMTPGLIPPIDLGFNPYLLAKLNAVINSAVTVLLIMGYIFIRQGKRAAHQRAMVSAFVLSSLFLVSYVLYHISVGHTVYCEAGLVPKGVYLTILLTHIALSVTIIPLASFSIYRALSERFDKHKRLARITFPLWLYVSITGVLVYFMIAPCHPVG